MATSTRSSGTKPRARTRPPRTVSPDSVDFRDRVYAPSLSRAPVAALAPPAAKLRPVLNQKSTDACTGFALATAVHVLLGRRDKVLAETVSPFMLYGMARRYDNLPGQDPTDGSTCRGALKGWFKHGASAADLWPGLEEPVELVRGVDWWDDAVRRPLGAYYRVEPGSVVDMQVALNETGVLLASADTHGGWDAGYRDAKPRARSVWAIPYADGAGGGGGHAFAIVGYTATGFVLQNSWGKGWGSAGLAVLSYADWLANGYDCWVMQLGVVTDMHRAAARGGVAAHMPLAAVHTGVLDIHALSPYVVDTGNDGELSAAGDFHTREQDLDMIVDTLMPSHRAEWQIPAAQPLDVALYAHGGLADERAAARTASVWIPLLKQAHIFPLVFMWESGLIDTLLNEVKDAFRSRGEIPTGGMLSKVDRWWSDRIEGMARLVGKRRWAEVKENARLLSENPAGGARLLVQRLAPLRRRVRVHLIGHSAGAIVHAHLAELLVSQGFTVESLTLLAPAARMDLFDAKLLPLLRNGSIKRMAQFHLTDACEGDEGGMRAALGYKRSLLYLISNGLEEQRSLPVLGMQRFFDRHVAPLALPSLQTRVAPQSPATQATRHGGFDDDAATQRSVVAHLVGRPIPA